MVLAAGLAIMAFSPEWLPLFTHVCVFSERVGVFSIHVGVFLLRVDERRWVKSR